MVLFSLVSFLLTLLFRHFSTHATPRWPHVEVAEPPKESFLAISWKIRRRTQDAIGRQKKRCICQISKLPSVRPVLRKTSVLPLRGGEGGSSGYHLGDDKPHPFHTNLSCLSRKSFAGLASCACLQTGHAGRTNVHTYNTVHTVLTVYGPCVFHAALCALRDHLVFFPSSFVNHNSLTIRARRCACVRRHRGGIVAGELAIPWSMGESKRLNSESFFVYLVPRRQQCGQ